MAIDVAPRFTFYRQNTGLALPFTVCFWARFDSTPVAYRTLFVHAGNSYGSFVGIFRNSAGQISIGGGTGSDKALSSALSNGTWYFIGVVAATGTNNFLLYWRAAGTPTLSSVAGTRDGSFLNEQLVWCGGPNSATPGLGEDAAHCHDGAIAYGRVFSGALTQAQLLSESASTVALQTEYADWAFASTANSTTDSSGSGNTLTTAGTGSQANDTNPNISIGVATLTETDALVASQRSGSKAATAIAETDTLAGATRAHAAAATAITEIDNLAAATRTHSSTVFPVGESDALDSVARTSSQTVGVLAEVDGAAPVARTSNQTVAVLTETDTEAAASATHTSAAALLGESDSLSPADRAASQIAGLLTEIDQLVAAATPAQVGVLAESDLLVPVLHATSRSASPFAEVDSLSALAGTLAIPDDLTLTAISAQRDLAAVSTRYDLATQPGVSALEASPDSHTLVALED